MDLRDKRDIYNGFGDTLARAFELAGTPLVFGFIGHLLDRWLGLTPVLTIGLGALAVVGGFLQMYYGYRASMRRQEATAPWGRSRA